MPAFDNLNRPFDSESQSEAPCRWLSAGQDGNPFVIDGYDCLALVTSLVTATSDPNIARKFVALRESSGREYAGELPAEAREIRYALAYPVHGAITEGPVFKASQMEEKWDVYLYDQRLYFCRSWTGELAYVGEFKITPASREMFPVFANAGSALTVSRIWASTDRASTGAGFAVRQTDYLIKRFLFQLRVPHPLPPDLRRDPETVGAYSFSQYGNMCCFGSFADTLPLTLVRPSWSAEVGTTKHS